LQASTTNGGLTSSTNKWYLATPRYAVEDTRLKALIGTSPNTFMGAYSLNTSTLWYWPVNTDGFSAAVNFSNGGTAVNSAYTSWASSEPNGGSTGDRSGEYYPPNGNVALLGWDDILATTTLTAYLAETFSTTPISTGATGAAALTVRPVTAAGAPTGLVAGTPATSVALSWVAPAAAGTDSITDYVIQYSSDQVTWTTFSDSVSTSTSATVTGLTASTLYSFRVATVTSVQSAWSTAVSSPKADAPTSLVANPSGSTSLSLSWTAPANTYNSSTVTGYQIQYLSLIHI
jgi:hypothetical protein